MRFDFNPAALKQVQGDKKRSVIPNSFRNRKVEVDKYRPGDHAGNQTFFTKSKILEKVVKRVQGDENVRSVIPNLFRNRQIGGNKPKSCR